MVLPSQHQHVRRRESRPRPQLSLPRGKRPRGQIRPLMPVSARRQLNDLPDDLWTKISIEFSKDGADAVFKALTE